jgi:hypothetical protein
MNDALLAEVLRKLGLAVLERHPFGVFSMLTVPPTWLRHAFQDAPAAPSPTLSGALPFLDYFLPDAQRAWDEGGQAIAETGLFTATVDGEDILLQARALTVAGRPLAILERLTGDADVRPSLQTARENLLAHEQLQRQVAAARAAVDSVATEVLRLEGTDLTPDQQRAVDALAHAHKRLRAALDGA